MLLGVLFMANEQKEENTSELNSRRFAVVKPMEIATKKIPINLPSTTRPCKHLFLWIVLPLLVLIIGVLLRGIVSTWLPIPVEPLILLMGLLVVVYVVTLLYQRNIEYLSNILLAIVSVFGIVLVALLTQAWTAFWAWLTILIPLTAFAAVAGTMMTSEMLERCRKIRVKKPYVIRHRQNGILKLTVMERREKTSE
jgi:hypothetical protein